MGEDGNQADVGGEHRKEAASRVANSHRLRGEQRRPQEAAERPGVRQKSGTLLLTLRLGAVRHGRVHEASWEGSCAGEADPRAGLGPPLRVATPLDADRERQQVDAGLQCARHVEEAREEACQPPEAAASKATAPLRGREAQVHGKEGHDEHNHEPDLDRDVDPGALGCELRQISLEDVVQGGVRGPALFFHLRAGLPKQGASR
mmetsp:Transcript_121930/g.344881  ORF Transcript_121930/g.344881 Transcript_121930/m.344881 type:complete len:204 (+) Transcript_121930:596-1207(+)